MSAINEPKKNPRHNLSLSQSSCSQNFAESASRLAKDVPRHLDLQPAASRSVDRVAGIRIARTCKVLQENTNARKSAREGHRRLSTAISFFFVSDKPLEKHRRRSLLCRLAPSAAPSSCEEKTGTGLDEHSSPRCENGWTEILQFPSLTLIPYLLSAFLNEIEFLLKNPHLYFTYLREGTQRVFCNFL